MFDVSKLNFLREAIASLKGLVVQACNLEARKLGFSEGKELLAVFTCSKVDELVEKIRRGESFKERLEVYFFEPQTKKHVEISFIPEGGVIVVNDLTEEKKLNDAKLDFVTAVSHELTTPLSALKGNLVYLKEIENDPKKLEVLKRMEKSVERLEITVNQLKTLSMVQLGLYELKIEEVDLEELMREVVEDFKEELERKRIDLNIALETERIETDRFVFKTILKNLLSNAVKYSYPSSTISVFLGPDRLSVRDEGIGIKDEEKDRIFERFYRGSEATKMASGSGLGLSIVKHLCNMMGYGLEVKSKWLMGSEFIVRFKG